MFFLCLLTSQKTSQIFVRISALGSKNRPNKKGRFIPLIGEFFLNLALLFWFDLFFEDRVEILKNIPFVFWEIRRHQKDISKLTDLYEELQWAWNNHRYSNEKVLFSVYHVQFHQLNQDHQD